MSARISHIVSVSQNPRQVGTMYETLFGLNFIDQPLEPDYGEMVHDGQVAMTLHARLAGHRMGLDSFGVELDDIDETLAAIRRDYPAIGAIDQPANTPFRGKISHDPAGNIFSLTEAGRGIEVPATRERPWNFDRWSDGDDTARIFSHYALRTRKISETADFYEKYFGFSRLSKTGDDPNEYLSDGRMTLLLIPWSIQDYGGISVTGRGPDHIGFRVEDADLMIREFDLFSAHFSPGQSPVWRLDTINERSDESQVRAKMIADSCPISRYQFTDKDGTFVVISDRNFGE